MRRNAADYGKQAGRGFDPRRLHLKIRVSLTRRMRESEVFAAISETLSTGEVAEGIELHWIDWAKGEEGSARHGRIDSDVQDALLAFWGAISGGDEPRIAPVKGE